MVHDVGHQRRASTSEFGRGLAAFVQRFAADERGVSAVIYGIMFTFMFLAAAVAVDHSRATKEAQNQQSALDLAILAASDLLGGTDEGTTVQQRAERFFAANMPPGSTATISVAMDEIAGEITGTTGNAHPTTLFKSAVLKEARRDKIDIGANARVVRGDGTIEIGLVVDNSGSMAGTYIDALKSAATKLVNVVFSGSEGSDKVKVGVIPFASSVNVGSAYGGADWIDGAAESSLHSENFSEPKSRFDLFSDLSTNWGGCVEVRPAPYDVQDTEPTASQPDTRFVPMFAPDEPDDVSAEAAGTSYSNNYISDFGGTCPEPDMTCIVFNKKKNKCTTYGPAPIDVALAQSRTCKYAGATQAGGSGPNYGCSTQPLLALSQSKTTVQAAIDALTAGGNTNIGEGTMWGWRVLSPEAPFTDGRAYDESENRKVLVVMTDGANTYSGTSNHNKSRYGAFGYGVKDRLGTTYSSSAYSDAMDLKLASACTNAKTAGVTIYTVAFRLEGDASTRALLSACATSTDHAFTASSESALVQAFETIGRNISRLRVAG
ncbi:MAG: VWA domain-containing protein [Hyphomicrobium sp.]